MKDFLSTTQAKDIMTRNMICVHPSTSIKELSSIFIENNITGAPVVDTDRKLVGFVSQTDIVELDLHSDDYLESRMEETGGFVQDIMTSVDMVAQETDSLATVIDKMCTEKRHRLIIVDEQENLAGLITTMDIMYYLRKAYQSGT
jgi:predicted transcriptional regulator